MGDLVEICNTESIFKAHPNMLSGKIGLVTKEPVKHSNLLIYLVLVEGHTISIMEDHLREPEAHEKIKTYEEYTD
jgi:hypothetical protein